MNWPAAGPGRARAARATTTSNSGRSLRMGPFSRLRWALAQEHACPSDLLGRDHTEEIGEQSVHQLEVGRQRRDALVLRVQHLLGEALLVEELSGLRVDEVEVRAQAEA